MTIKAPSKLLPWLEADSSITDMARAIVSDVNLDLLMNEWSPENSDVFERRIVMRCDGEPWWFAVTHIPKKTYEQRLQAFQALGQRHLGSILFSDPDIYRLSVIHCFEPAGGDNFQEAKPYITVEASGVWVRKQVFLINKEPLYLKEIFLPQMLESL